MFALEFGELFSRKLYIHYRLLYGKCNIPAIYLMQFDIQYWLDSFRGFCWSSGHV